MWKLIFQRNIAHFTSNYVYIPSTTTFIGIWSGLQYVSIQMCFHIQCIATIIAMMIYGKILGVWILKSHAANCSAPSGKTYAKPLAILVFCSKTQKCRHIERRFTTCFVFVLSSSQSNIRAPKASAGAKTYFASKKKVWYIWFHLLILSSQKI